MRRHGNSPTGANTTRPSRPAARRWPSPRSRLEPHFLLAQLAQLRGDFEQAGELLDKTLYLDPGNVAAYLELAALCERADNLPRAQTLRRAALDIVRALPGDAVVEPYETTAAEMAQWLT